MSRDQTSRSTVEIAEQELAPLLEMSKMRKRGEVISARQVDEPQTFEPGRIYYATGCALPEPHPHDGKRMLCIKSA